MSEKEEAREKIGRAFEKWLKPLGLLWLDIRVVYYGKKKDTQRVFVSKEDGGIVAAKCYADWRYGTATIEVNVPAFYGMSAEEVETIILHELCHVLVNEMREGADHHEERVVTGLTKAFMWVYKAGKGELK